MLRPTAVLLNGPSGALQTTFKILRGLMISMFLAVGEEIGWRGYLLPLGCTRALLLSGLLHGIWHLPLMFLMPSYHASGNPWAVTILFLLTLTVAGVFYGYLRLTSDSVWSAALAHGAFNTFWTTLSAMTIAAISANEDCHVDHRSQDSRIDWKRNKPVSHGLRLLCVRIWQTQARRATWLIRANHRMSEFRFSNSRLRNSAGLELASP